MSEYNIEGRAELIVGLQEVLDEGRGMPLSYAADELRSVPAGAAIDGIETARKMPVDEDMFVMLPAAMHGVAERLREQLAGLLDGSGHEAAYVASLNLDAIADHTTRMQTLGTRAWEALAAMRVALDRAHAEAVRIRELLAAAAAEAEAGVTAQRHFTQALGGFVESL